MNDSIPVVIADDHPLFRTGLRDVIASAGHFRVVGEAADGAGALGLIEAHMPRVAVLDVEMPKATGLEVAEAVKARGLPTALVILTMHEDGDILERALQAGVKGYVLKESAADEITACLNLVTSGKMYLSPRFSSHLAERLRKPMAGARPSTDPLQTLTPSERDILQRVAKSGTTEAIAQELGISPKTVEKHRSNICGKLGLSGTNALLRYALEHRAELT